MIKESEIFNLLINKNKKIIKKEHFDDAAIINIGEMSLAISTDFIRGKSFNIYEACELSFYDLAHYLLAANASDIASMGIRPSGFLNIFRYPLDVKTSDQLDFFEGLHDASKHYKVEIVGGDSGSYNDYVMGGTCFGFSEKRNFLYRSKAEPGDLIYVTKGTGMCRASQIVFLEMDKKIFTEIELNTLKNSWKKPTPPLNLGPWLSEKGYSICAQDTSDGLKETLFSIMNESDVGVTLEKNCIPLNDILLKISQNSNRDAADIALSISPDFQLLFTTKSKYRNEIESSDFGDSLNCIGEITHGNDLSYVENGRSSILNKETWDQTIKFSV